MEAKSKMSIRTLIEINHDKLHDIEKDPEGFVKRMCDAIRAGGTYQQMHSDDGYTGDTHGRFWAAGGAVKYSRHHSSECPTEKAGKPYVHLEV
jgi:hypothetical protein